MPIELKIGKLTAEKVTKIDPAIEEMFGPIGGGHGGGLAPPYYAISEGKEFLFEVKHLEEAPEIFAKLVGRKAQEFFTAELTHKKTGARVFSY